MAQKTRLRPPERYPVEVEVDGRTHKGYYTLGQKLITVHLIGGGSTTTQWSATNNNDTLARMMLLELIPRG